MRIPCHVDNEKKNMNVADLFTAMFIIGFALHAINFTIATFIEPTLRLQYVEVTYEAGLTEKQRILFRWSFYLEHVFRVIFLVFSIT